MESTPGRCVIEVQQSILEQPEPQPKKLRPTKPSDYPRVAAVYLDVAQKLASPLLMGPPLCDELVALVEHLLTEEEAGLMRHLGMFRGRSARSLARDEHRPLDQVEPILRRLSEEKRVIVAQRIEREEPLPAPAAHAGHVRDGVGPAVARFAHRLAPPLRRVVRGPLRDRLHGGLSRADDALGAVPAGGQGAWTPIPWRCRRTIWKWSWISSTSSASGSANAA